VISQPKDKQVLQALVDLQGNPAWAKVRGWLEAELASLSEANDAMQDEVPLRQGQGGALTLRKVLQVQDSARDALDKQRK